MLGVSGKAKMDPRPLSTAVDKAAYRNFGHAGGSIRKQAIASIVSNQPSGKAGKKKGRRQRTISGPPGQPYRTRRGLARRAMRYAASKTGVVIGPEAGKIGTAMAAHEHGLKRGKIHYKKRPTMALALKAQLGRVSATWRNSIGA